jgi:outer membrane protein TolC
MNKINQYKKYIIFCMLIMLSLTVEAFSQVRELTLQEAINEAYKNNSELINARYDKVKADFKVSQTYNESLIPSITLNSQYIRTFKKQVFDIFGQKYEIGSDNQIQNTINLQEPIPILGTPIFQGIKVAEYYSKMSEENVRAIETKVRTDVKKAFLNTLLLTQIVEVTDKSLRNAQENLNNVEVKYKGGVVTEFDYLRAKVKVESIKPTLSEAKNNLVLSTKALKNAIGMKTDDEVTVTGNLEYDSTEVIGNISKIVSDISDNNVNMRLLRINRNINQVLVDIDKANYLPKLYIFGQYGLGAMENDGKNLWNYSFFNTVNAGIGLTYTFNLFSNPQKKQQSEIEVKKSEEQLKDVKEKLKIQSQSVILRIQNAKERILSTKETVNLAERGYELAQINYKAGVINQIDVLDAELSLTQSRLSQLQAIYDYLTAKAELEGLLEK